MAWKISDQKALSIGIIGAGIMGRGIAQVLAQAGMKVLLYDIDEKVLDAGIEFAKKMIDRLYQKGKIDKGMAESSKSLIIKTINLSDFAVCDLVIEAAVENLDIKKEIFYRLEKIVKEDCILATNTSSLSVTSIAAACNIPSRVAGFHFFNPVPLMKVVEVVKAINTENWVCDVLIGIGNIIGYTTILTKDTPGFVVNHLGRAYATEALTILSESVAEIEDIDIILRKTCDFPMGPFELFDLTGIDVSHPATESIYHQFYEDPRYRPSYILQRRLEGKLLGRKTGQGFYKYDNSGKKIIREETANIELVDKLKIPKIWVGGDRSNVNMVKNLILKLGGKLDEDKEPSKKSICMLVPELGKDATTTSVELGVDPEKSVAIETFYNALSKHITLMKTVVTSDDTILNIKSLFGESELSYSIINDSPGFVIQRVLAMIINTACTITQQNIASPHDIDKAVKLALGYPFGPLEWGDLLGGNNILQILNNLFDFYKDPRYRPIPWLIRRAKLNISLLKM